jgi:homeobox protein cut-like
MTDLDRANQRALTAEKRLEKYHEESQSMTSHIPQKTMVDTTSLELELQAKDRELVNVRGDVERLQRNVKSISESSTSRIESLEEQLAAQSLRVKELEKIMQEQSDYHEIKKELNILRTVEFSSSTSEVTSTVSLLYHMCMIMTEAINLLQLMIVMALVCVFSLLMVVRIPYTWKFSRG